jgi:hypothetical protein
MNTISTKSPIAAALAGMVILSACATNPDGSYKYDARATGALIGAVTGCAFGAATHGGKGCAAGAVVGAAAGFLIGWYFESKKTATAEQINAEYENGTRNRGIDSTPPKDSIVPARFDTKVSTGQADSSGQREIQVTSNTDLIGYGDRVPEVEQRYAIYDEKNNLIEEKTEKLETVDGAGRYQTNSKFKLPAEAKNKSYTVKTTLVANQKTYKENAYKVTLGDSLPTRLALIY